jgi:hypothetical protein
MKIVLASVIGLLTALGVVAQTPSDRAAGLMTPAQFQALPSKPADYRLSYGTDANQFGELRVPSGVGPHPVAILIHGGWWKAEYGSLRDLAPTYARLQCRIIWISLG